MDTMAVMAVVEEALAGLAVVKDILAAVRGGSLGMAVSEINILIGRVEEGYYLVFDVGILVMEGYGRVFCWNGGGLSCCGG